MVDSDDTHLPDNSDDTHFADNSVLGLTQKKTWPECRCFLQCSSPLDLLLAAARVAVLVMVVSSRDFPSGGKPIALSQLTPNQTPCLKNISVSNLQSKHKHLYR